MWLVSPGSRSFGVGSPVSNARAQVLPGLCPMPTSLRRHVVQSGWLRNV